MEFRYSPPPYSRERGVRGEFEGDYKIEVRVEHGVVTIRANNDGLISLAKHCISLAQGGVSPGAHFHFDPGLILADGSAGLVIARIPDPDQD